MTKLRMLKPSLREMQTTTLKTLPSTGGRFDDPNRSSRHARGYGTAWDKLRKTILERDGNRCQECLRQHGSLLFTLARHVDHIVPRSDGGSDDPSNLQSLCKPCHDEKSRRENAARASARAWP